MTKASPVLQAVATAAVLLAIWWVAVALFAPRAVHFAGTSGGAGNALAAERIAVYNAGITLLEIIIGLICGTVLGVATALAVNSIDWAKRYVMPVVMASQALPVFAIAPLLVLWFGLGLGSKIAMATLIIYFPVASALNDGLRRADGQLIDLARLYRATPWETLRYFRLPAAMPSLASGLRVAATIAPIGAVVGEWVGAAGGLGYVINQANARMQTDTVFAALLLLIVMVVLLRWAVDLVLDHLVHWVPRTETYI